MASDKTEPPKTPLLAGILSFILTFQSAVAWDKQVTSSNRLFCNFCLGNRILSLFPWSQSRLFLWLNPIHIAFTYDGISMFFSTKNLNPFTKSSRMSGICVWQPTHVATCPHLPTPYPNTSHESASHLESNLAKSKVMNQVVVQVTNNSYNKNSIS